MEKMVVDLLNQFEHGKISRRQLVQGLTLGVMAAAASTPALAQGKAKARSGSRQPSATVRRNVVMLLFFPRYRS